MGRKSTFEGRVFRFQKREGGKKRCQRNTSIGKEDVEKGTKVLSRQGRPCCRKRWPKESKRAPKSKRRREHFDGVSMLVKGKELSNDASPEKQKELLWNSEEKGKRGHQQISDLSNVHGGRKLPTWCRRRWGKVYYGNTRKGKGRDNGKEKTKKSPPKKRGPNPALGQKSADVILQKKGKSSPSIETKRKHNSRRHLGEVRTKRSPGKSSHESREREETSRALTEGVQRTGRRNARGGTKGPEDEEEAGEKKKKRRAACNYKSPERVRRGKKKVKAELDAIEKRQATGRGLRKKESTWGFEPTNPEQPLASHSKRTCKKGKHSRGTSRVWRTPRPSGVAGKEGEGEASRRGKKGPGFFWGKLHRDT